MNITLDTKALNALFPEGSQARVDLRQAVVQNFVDREFMRFGNEELKKLVMEQVKEQLRDLPDVKELIRARIKSEFTQRGWNGVEMNEGFSTAMANETQRVVNEHINNLVEARTDIAVKHMTHRMEEQVELIVAQAEAKFDILVKNNLVSKWEHILNDAIKMKLGLS